MELCVVYVADEVALNLTDTCVTARHVSLAYS